jgi:hypothetical protein
VVPQAEVEIIAVEFDTPIVVDRDDSDLRLRLVCLLGVYPVHPGMTHTTGGFGECWRET